MTGSSGASVAIPLAGGGELRVTAEAVTLDERRYELGRIQDALQVSPEPETVALRVAGAGMVEFRPARQGDGRVALEAIYRLRPELRPAGFEPPGAPAGLAPAPPDVAAFAPPTTAYPPYPSAGGYPPSPYGTPGYAPPGYGTPYAPPYGAHPNANGGEVTPYPRRFWELIAAIFQIYLRKLPAWLGLGLLVGALPGAIGAGFQLVLLDLQGPAAFSGLQAGALGGQTLPSSCRFTYHAPAAATLARDGALLAGLAIAAAMLTSLATAALAIGAREALLGRRVRVGASVRGGLRRLPATLGVTVVTAALYALALGPALVCLELALVNLSGVDLCNASAAALPPNAVVGLFLDVAGLALIVPGVLVFLLIFVRLGPAPYVAATEPVGAGRAIARSWRLTRGSFWRTLGVVLVTQIAALVIATPFGAADSPPAAVALPALAHAVTAPLLAITWTAVLLDLRLRREGYDALRRGGEKPGVEAPPAP